MSALVVWIEFTTSHSRLMLTDSMETELVWNFRILQDSFVVFIHSHTGGSVAEWLACWTQAQKGPGSNRSRDAIG